MKKALALILAGIMVLSLFGCGSSDSGGSSSGGSTTPSGQDSGSSDTTPSGGGTDTSGSDHEDVLNVVYSQDRGTLNPMYNVGYDLLNAVRLCYDPLWDWDSQGNQIWKLATSMEMEDEGRTWIIHLREGVTFSNGNPFTADDVVFTLGMANNREGEPDYFPEMDLDNTVALDDYTVSVAFHNYDMSYVTSITSMCIMDVESYDEDDIMTNPIGTGPYVLTDYVVNSHLSFERKADYWGDPAGIGTINFYLYQEDSQKTNALTTNAIDITSVPFQDISYVENDLDGYTIYLAPSAQAMTRALYFNCTDNSEAFYNNPDARTAVAMAIDRDALNQIVYQGYAEVSRAPVSASCVDMQDAYLDYGVYGTGYDPEAAQALADSSGLTGRTLTLSTNGTAEAIACAECIQTDLGAIGVNVEIANYDSGSWLSVAFDVTACGDMLVDFTGVPSQTIAQNMSAWYLYHLGGGFTQSPFEGKEEYEQLIDGIMAVADASELDARYSRLIPIHTDALLWFSLCDMPAAYAYPSDLQGFQIMRMGHVDYSMLSWA